MKYLKHPTIGAVPLRLCLWVWSGYHEDGRMADVHLRYILHTKALPREGERLQTKQ